LTKNVEKYQFSIERSDTKNNLSYIMYHIHATILGTAGMHPGYSFVCTFQNQCYFSSENKFDFNS